MGERKKLETALLGKRAQFQCNVQSSDASEVTLWWQFGGQNLTTLTNDDKEGRHHSITVSKSASGAVTSVHRGWIVLTNYWVKKFFLVFFCFWGKV